MTTKEETEKRIEDLKAQQRLLLDEMKIHWENYHQCLTEFKRLYEITEDLTG